MPVDTRSSSAMFIIRKDLFDQPGINTLEALTDWKRRMAASRSSRSSLGGTNHVWASFNGDDGT